MQNVTSKTLIEDDQPFKNQHMKRWLHELVSDHPDFEVISQPARDAYCLRYVPNIVARRRNEVEMRVLLDRLNEEIVENVNRIGLSSATTTRVQGRVAIKVSCRSNVAITFEAIARWGRLLNAKRSLITQATRATEDSNV